MKRKILMLFLALAACVGMSATTVDDLLGVELEPDYVINLEAQAVISGLTFNAGTNYTLTVDAYDCDDDTEFENYFVFMFGDEAILFGSCDGTMFRRSKGSDKMTIRQREEEPYDYYFEVLSEGGEEEEEEEEGGGGSGEGDNVMINLSYNGQISYEDNSIASISEGTSVERYKYYDDPDMEEEDRYCWRNTSDEASTKAQSGLEVTACPGYTVTKVTFVLDGDAEMDDAEYPFVAYVWNGGVYSSVEAMNDEDNSQGTYIKDIRVYYEEDNNYMNLRANEDPNNEGDFYTTFFDGLNKYELPSGVEAYVGTLSGDELLLTKIAEGGQVIPNDNAVILKASVNKFALHKSEASPVSVASNDLDGTDDEIDEAPANCYVLSGHSNEEQDEEYTYRYLGFYQFTGTIPAHKAYLTISSSAPKRIRLVFDSATGIDNAKAADRAEKFIENGQLVIIKNGVRYNAQGKIVK